jgi:hypothetical protein
MMAAGSAPLLTWLLVVLHYSANASQDNYSGTDASAIMLSRSTDSMC